MTRSTGTIQTPNEAAELWESMTEQLGVDRVVDNRVYTDPKVFELENERIFSKIWMFVCHESEIGSPGDYITTSVAGNGLIVNRDREGELHAFYNVCRHRASEVVWDRAGHCAAFRCPYHFWVYSLEGELVSLPGEEAYEDTGFCKEDFPLIEVKCESTLGLVFVSLNPAVGTLEDWLGPEVIEALSKPLANGDLNVFRGREMDLDLNWKIIGENVRDGYHVPFVHPFYRKHSPPGPYRLYDHGHAVQELFMNPEGMEAGLWDQISQHPMPGVDVGEGYIVNVFPDLFVSLRSNFVSIDWLRPHAPDSLTLVNRTLGMATDDDQVEEVRGLSYEVWVGNRLDLEDIPIFEAQQRGVSSPGVRYSTVARGQESDTGIRGDDNRLRQFWVMWRELMRVNANSIE